jgi:ABC-type spermidine/putrescine transport system permease subunit I
MAETATADRAAAARFRARRAEAIAGLAMVAMPVAMLLVLVLVPTVRMIVGTFATPEGASLARYAYFFTDAYSLANLRYTVMLTLASCLTALTVSTLIALYLRFSEGRIATAVHALSLFPLFVPSIIISYALIRFLGPNGLFQMLLESVGITGYRTPYLTPLGPFLAFVWENVPLPVLVISAGLSQVSNAAVEAARDLGAGPLRILLEVLLPSLRRSLLVAFSLTFLSVIGAYTVPYMLGPPAPEMMGVFMQRTFGNLQDPDAAQVQAVVLIVLAGTVGSFYVLSMVRGARR